MDCNYGLPCKPCNPGFRYVHACACPLAHALRLVACRLVLLVFYDFRAVQSHPNLKPQTRNDLGLGSGGATFNFYGSTPYTLNPKP